MTDSESVNRKILRDFAVVGIGFAALSLAACSSSEDAGSTASGGKSASGGGTASGGTSSAGAAGIGSEGGGAGSGAGGDAGAASGSCKEPENNSPPGLLVSPTGSPGGDGSPAKPLDLATALSMSSPAVPGDVIYLEGGVYTGNFVSELAGTEAKRITVRSLPGSWAVLDTAGAKGHALWVKGPWTTFSDLELMNSSPHAPIKPPANSTGGGVRVEGKGNKLIHLVIHDAAGQGVGHWLPAEQSEVYGCIVFNNGRNANDDHGIYVQNGRVAPKKRIVHNIFFNNYAFGIHAYGTTSDVSNLHIEGNIVFNNGSHGATQGMNVFVGGGDVVDNNLVSGNIIYSPPGKGGAGLSLGLYSGSPAGVVATENYVVGSHPTVLFDGYAPPVTFRNNKLVNREDGLVQFIPSGKESSFDWNDNEYIFSVSGGKAFRHKGTAQDFSSWQASTGFDAKSTFTASAPAGVEVRTTKDEYEPGRAIVTILNWDLGTKVSVDASSFLEQGWAWEAINAQDPLAKPGASGVYSGSNIELPVGKLTVAKPINLPKTPPSVAPEFAVFVVRRTGCPSP